MGEAELAFTYRAAKHRLTSTQDRKLRFGDRVLSAFIQRKTLTSASRQTHGFVDKRESYVLRSGVHLEAV